MRVNKSTVYAVLAVAHIARHAESDLLQGRLIAEAYGIPNEYLLKILQLLVRNGILTSETGRRGGFSLSRPPAEISLLQIMEAVDGPMIGEVPTLERMTEGADVAARLKELLESLFASGRKMLADYRLDTLIQQSSAPSAMPIKFLGERRTSKDDEPKVPTI
ncbi:MAG: RrF2 family transcriptional regulator [Phycisphaerae bacterium]